MVFDLGGLFLRKIWFLRFKKACIKKSACQHCLIFSKVQSNVAIQSTYIYLDDELQLVTLCKCAIVHNIIVTYSMLEFKKKVHSKYFSKHDVLYVHIHYISHFTK